MYYSNSVVQNKNIQNNIDFFYQHYSNDSTTQKTIEKIQKYLFEKDAMFHYEFSLFNNFLPHFKSDFVILMIPITIKYLETINTKHEYFIENVQYYNNLSTYFYIKK